MTTQQGHTSAQPSHGRLRRRRWARARRVVSWSLGGLLALAALALAGTAVLDARDQRRLLVARLLPQPRT